MRTSRWSIASISVGFLAMVASCVTAPLDGDRYLPSRVLDMTGYASKPGETIQVQAASNCTGGYGTVATFVSGTTPTTFNGDTLYAWSGSFQFDQVPEWWCYWPLMPSGSFKRATLRVRQLSDGNALTTFAYQGLSCVIDKLSQGVGWLDAGYQCRSDNSPLLYLYWNQIR